MVDDINPQLEAHSSPVDKKGISIDDFLSAQIDFESDSQKFDPETFIEQILSKDITILTDDLGEDSDKVVRDEQTGAIILDSQHLDAMILEVMETFTGAYEAGNLRDHPAYGRMLQDVPDERLIEIYQQLRSALDTRDITNPSLANFEADLPFRTLAERQMIKDKLMTEINQMPVNWKTVTAADGGALDQETEIEYLLIQDGDEFKLVVASTRGIESLEVIDPAVLTEDNFTLTSAKKAKDGTITLEIGKNKRGKSSLVQSVHIIKDRLDDRLRKQLTETAKVKRETRPPYPGPASAPSRTSTSRSSSTNWVSGEGAPRSSTPRYSG